MRATLLSLATLAGALSLAGPSPTLAQASATDDGAERVAAPELPLSAPDTLRTFVDYDSAKTYAGERDLDILMVYAGSDWCRPCKAFKRSILSDATFKQTAGEAVALLYLDFPAKRSNKLPRDRQDHNDALAERYNPSGVFPKILLFDADGGELGELTYEGQDPETFAAQLAAARAERG